MAKLPECPLCAPLLGPSGWARSLEFQLTDLKWLELLQGEKMGGKNLFCIYAPTPGGERLWISSTGCKRIIYKLRPILCEKKNSVLLVINTGTFLKIRPWSCWTQIRLCGLVPAAPQLPQHCLCFLRSSINPEPLHNTSKAWGRLLDCQDKSCSCSQPTSIHLLKSNNPNTHLQDLTDLFLLL